MEEIAGGTEPKEMISQASETKKFERRFWAPYWAKLKDVAEDELEFVDKNCGNCDRGILACIKRYPGKENQWGCGYGAKTEKLTHGMVLVTSPCSGASHVIDGKLLKMCR